jgi:hypothetical protein
LNRVSLAVDGRSWPESVVATFPYDLKLP